MEKVNARLAVVAVVLLGLLLLAAQGADAKAMWVPRSMNKLINCKAAGTCDKKYSIAAAAADPTRPMDPANKYTRGCSPIHKCRG